MQQANKYISVILLIIITIILSACTAPRQADFQPNISLSEQCKKADGTWLQEYNECEGINSSQCQVLAGEFNECASACRHQPEGRVCTMQCVTVCNI